MSAIVLLDLALTLIEKLLPEIEARVKAGDITTEEQLAARTRYDALRARRGSIFAGPEWQPSDRNDPQV